MQFVKSTKFSAIELETLNIAIIGIFSAINEPIATYLPHVSIFVSKDPEEKPDYIVDINKLLVSSSLFHQSLELVNLFSFIFPNVYIEPRNILAAYKAAWENAEKGVTALESNIEIQIPTLEVTPQVIDSVNTYKPTTLDSDYR
jgi:hypothetical protein